MFDLFGFTPTDFSDDELLEKWNQVTGKMVWAARFGSADMLTGLQRMKVAIEFEQRDRMIGSRQRAMATRNVVIETDPDLALIEKQKVEAAQVAAQPKTTSRRVPIVPTAKERLRPSAKPQND
jgi:hypothetical protein